MSVRSKMLGVAILGAAVVAGCGGKDPTTTPVDTSPGETAAATNPAGKSANDTPTTTKGVSAQSNPAGLPSACQLITKVDVASAYGTTAADGKLDDDADNQCTFEIDGQTKAGKVGLFSEVSVQVDTRDDDGTYAKTKTIFPAIQKLDVGDDSWYYDLVVAQVHIMKGKYQIVISGPILADKELSKQMAIDLGKVALTRLK